LQDQVNYLTPFEKVRV